MADSPSMPTPDHEEAYAKAVDLLKQCLSPDGFLASLEQKANYRRVWARDGIIMGLAALLSDDAELHACLRTTLQTLVRHQGPHGEIPSNVDELTGHVSYGGTTGRVDADLWFIIGCTEYWLASGEDTFIDQLAPALERVRHLLGAWEFNNRGLLYVPQAGDWADEYIHSGYVLYDQILYYQAQLSLCRVHEYIDGTVDHDFVDRVHRLKHLIRTNYWFADEQENNRKDVYHELLYEKGLRAAESCRDHYWLPFFAPTGYGYRFDAFANVLASLCGIASERRAVVVDNFIASITNEEMPLLPAFYPPIEPFDRDWDELQMTFSYTFKNKPHEYHNAGLWPMISGFYVADLARRGHVRRAQRYLNGINKANALAMNGQDWSFPEFVNGETLSAGGSQHQGWSAAATIIGYHSLQGKPLLRVDDDGH